MPSTSNDFFVLVWMLNWNWTYIVKEFLLKDCQEQCFLQIFIVRLPEAKFPKIFLLEDCREQCFLKIFVGRLSGAVFPSSFYWKIVGSSVSFQFLLEDCRVQCFLQIFIGRLSGAVFPSNLYWKIVRSRFSFEFLCAKIQLDAKQGLCFAKQKRLFRIFWH